MVHSLALGGRAPAALARLSPRQVPIRAINFSAAFMLIGVGLNYLAPEEVFVWVTSTVLIGSLWTWSMIMLAHLGYRRAVRAGRAAAVGFRMPGAPFANWIVLVFLAGAGAMLWLDSQTRVALYIAPVWFACLAVGYSRCKRTQ
jgi:amino acid transporter, AAT family